MRKSLYFVVCVFLFVGSLLSNTVLRVPISNDKPYAYFDEDGEPTGVAVDILEYIGTKYDLTFNYIPLGGNDIGLDDFEKNNLDILLAVYETEDNSAWLDFTRYHIYKKFFKIHLDGVESFSLRGKEIALVSGSECVDFFNGKIEDPNISFIPVYFDNYEESYQAFQDDDVDAVIVESLNNGNQDILDTKMYSVEVLSVSYPKIAVSKALPPEILESFDKELNYLHNTHEGRIVLNNILNKYQMFKTFKQEFSTIFFNCLLFLLLMVCSQSIRLFQNYGMKYSFVTWGAFFAGMSICLLRFGIDVNSGYLLELLKAIICLVVLFYGFYAGLIVFFVVSIYGVFICGGLAIFPCVTIAVAFLLTLILRASILKNESMFTSSNQLYISKKNLGALLLILIVTTVANFYYFGMLNNIMLFKSVVLPFGFLYMLTVAITIVMFNSFIAKGKMTKSLLDNETKLRTLMYSIGDGVFTVDSELKILFANNIALKLTGWSEDDAIGRFLRDVLVTVDTNNNPVNIPVEQVLQSNKVVQSEKEIVLISKTGGRCYISDAITPIKNQAKGFIEGAVVVIRDITGVVESAAKLKEKEELLKDAQQYEILGRLAGGVAHDFNNIFQIIIGFGELIEDSVDEGVTEMLSYVHNAAYRGKRLVKELMLFSCKEKAKMSVVNLSKALFSLKDFLGKLCSDSVELSFNIEPDIYVNGDIDMLEQVVVNLCVNATAAIGSNSGHINVEVTSELLEEKKDKLKPGKYAVIKIKDNGCGMSDELLGEIFTPFFTTKDIGVGTGGMGLASAFGIIEQHEGCIFVESEELVGSVFRIYIPLGLADKSSNIDLEISKNKIDKDSYIMVVEDDEEILSLMVTILENCGFRVLKSTDGVEAMALFREYSSKISLIVADVELPNMNGKEMYKNIRKQNGEQPIVFCSGYGLDFANDEFYSTENVALLQKPFSSKEFTDIVMKSLSAQIS
jgi:PAS domain S-box-containing protein